MDSKRFIGMNAQGQWIDLLTGENITVIPLGQTKHEPEITKERFDLAKQKLERFFEGKCF